MRPKQIWRSDVRLGDYRISCTWSRTLSSCCLETFDNIPDSLLNCMNRYHTHQHRRLVEEWKKAQIIVSSFLLSLEYCTKSNWFRINIVTICLIQMVQGCSPGARVGVLGLIFAGYVSLASQCPYPIIVCSVANYRPHLSHFGSNM